MFRDDVIAPTDLLAAVEQAADGIVITDIQGRIRYVNPEFSRMTGYTSKEVIGKHPRILKSGSHSQYFYKELWSTILSGRTWSGDVVNRRKDGTLYQERMRITPVRSPVGEIDSFIAIKQDVSELRAAEKGPAVPRRDCGECEGRNLRLLTCGRHSHVEQRSRVDFRLQFSGSDRAACVNADATRTDSLCPAVHYPDIARRRARL